MPTRAAAAREARSHGGQAKYSVPRDVDTLSADTTPSSKRIVQDTEANQKGDLKSARDITAFRKSNLIKGDVLASAVTDRKRRRSLRQDKELVHGEVIRGWHELPHNLGAVEGAKASFTASLSGTSLAKQKIKDVAREGLENNVKEEDDDEVRELPPTKRLTRAARTVKREAGAVETETRSKVEDEKPKAKCSNKSPNLGTSDGILDKVQDIADAADVSFTQAKRPRKQKKNPYGLTPGETPFPDFAMPSAETAYEVNRLLSELHGEVKAPKEIPAPSLEVTGCGEVPSVLDALIRTLLSAATTGRNSAAAFKGLVDTYGLCEEGIGKGSVDWNKVRDSPQQDVEEAIRSGGLAKAKSTNIKKILDIVHQQNMDRREAFLTEKRTGKPADVLGWDTKSQGQKDMEIETANSNILSLQYMHGLEPELAMAEFTKLPGIGVKTSSCVILFCLQRPSFAVDTHVWRLCKWLGWVPENATRDQTFSHCEVRVPNELKYSLHQLFIRHGKTCGRCRAATGETSEAWEAANCPIEQLVTRTGSRKGGSLNKKTVSKKGKKTMKAAKWSGDSDGEDEPLEPELSDGSM